MHSFFVGKKTGMNVSQIYPEDGNMGKVLPKYLTEWTTNKVRKGKLLQIFSELCCEYEDDLSSILEIVTVCNIIQDG